MPPSHAVTPAGCCSSAESTARGELGLCHNVATETSTYATPVCAGTAVIDADAVADGPRDADTEFDADAAPDRDAVTDRDVVADGAAGATDGVADDAVGPTDSADGEAANDCDETGTAGCVEGAPACTPDDATDPLSDPTDAPGEPDDLALLEQPASIPSAARLTPAHRRPRIVLL
jgi:hypothetical protein